MNDDYDISKLKKKPRKNSRKKGNTFENQIAKLLNDRFNTTDFSRTPGSGAFATTHSLPEHLKIYGDLITPKDFKYCIECKKGYNKETLYSLYNYSSDFWKFIDQAQNDADKAKKEPLLIFKQDRQKILAVVGSNTIPKSLYPCIKVGRFNQVYNIYLLNDLLKEETEYWFQ